MTMLPGKVSVRDGPLPGDSGDGRRLFRKVTRQVITQPSAKGSAGTESTAAKEGCFGLCTGPNYWRHQTNQARVNVAREVASCRA